MSHRYSIYRSVRLLLIAFLFTLVAYAEAPSKNTAFVDALWVAESSRVLKVAQADGSVLLQIPNTGELSALAVDASLATLSPVLAVPCRSIY